MKLRPVLLNSLLLFFATCSFTYSQNIYTIAGIAGQPGYTGDGGPATSARLAYPFGLATDHSGNLYIADGGTNVNVITKINSAGIITTVATSRPLDQPTGVAVDNLGNLYISEYSSSIITKVTPMGTASTFAGNGTAGYSGDGGPATSARLNHPIGVAVDNAGNVYISDDNKVVRKVNSAGIISTFAGNGTSGYSGDGGPAISAQLKQASGLATDNAGNVYIGDPTCSVIRKVSPAGIISTFAGNGTAGYSGDGGPATNAQFQNVSPQGIAIDNEGNVYASDYQNQVIRKINTAGIITTIAGTGNQGYSGDGGPAIAAQLWFPVGIAVDDAGIIYFTTTYGGTVRKIASCMPTSFNLQPADKSICENTTANFTVTATNAVTYQWQENTGSGWTDIADGGIYSGATTNALTINQVSPAMNNYQYRCAAGNLCSNAFSSAALLAVTPTPASSLTISTPQTTICSGTPVSFQAVATNAGTDPSYQWQLNGINTGANNSVYTNTALADGDIINCILTSKLTCMVPVESNDQIKMTVHAVPLVVTSSDTTLSQGASVPLNVSATEPIASYRWAPASGLNNASIANPVATPVNTVNYQVTATSTGGCTGYGNVTITVIKKIVLPNAFTPNGDGKNDVFRIPAGITFTLKDFSIFNRWGHMVFHTSDINKGWDGTINGIAADEGTYVFMISGSLQKEQVFVKGAIELIR